MRENADQNKSDYGTFHAVENMHDIDKKRQTFILFKT